MVRITRRELRGRHLLLEYARAPAAGKAATRWLVPLPVLAGLRDNLPAEIAAAAAAEEARLRASLNEPEAAAHPGSNGNSPQAEFGANPICPKVLLIKEEEEEEDTRKISIFLLLKGSPRSRAATGRGVRGEGEFSPSRTWGQLSLGQILRGAIPPNSQPNAPS